MFAKIIVQALVLSTTSTVEADACSIRHRITNQPTLCEPHVVGAPVYDDTICCAGGACFPSLLGGCASSETPYYCEFGEVDATGAMHCYFEAPNYCDVYTCPPGDGGQQDWICCTSEDHCVPAGPDYSKCSGIIYACIYGSTNDDGTVDCEEKA